MTSRLQNTLIWIFFYIVGSPFTQKDRVKFSLNPSLRAIRRGQNRTINEIKGPGTNGKRNNEEKNMPRTDHAIKTLTANSVTGGH